MKEITITSQTGLTTIIEIGYFDELIVKDDIFHVQRKDTLTDTGYPDQQIPLTHIKSITFNE